jgi:hypothetical protein
MWTSFWDMHSGGGSKEKWEHIFIQAPESEARVIFYNRFGHSPDRVTCTCCGYDYSVSEYENLDAATEFHRSGKFGSKKQTTGQYAKNKNVLVIYDEDILDEERVGDVPAQGYVWID